MKTLPTVVASVRAGTAISLDEFDDILRAPNRDAFDYVFRARSFGDRAARERTVDRRGRAVDGAERDDQAARRSS